MARAAPHVLDKRIQQTISDSTAKWEQACLAAGGRLKCNPLSVTAFSTLLAAAGPCEQQDAADSMIQLAQSLNNDPDMIKLTQIFVQQPRNTPNSVSVPYCQTAPASPLLSGLFQCQFQGASATTFVGGLSVGAPGTVPFGLKTLSPLGSCKAHPSGPIADGTQLVDLTQDPGVSSSDSNSTNGIAASSVASAAPETTTSASVVSPPAATPAITASSVAAAASTSAASTLGFQLQNGQAAQKLNAQFQTLTINSSCTEGEQACVGTSFAQCVSGAFVLTPCSAGTVCAALPLVNKPGTSIACDTSADVDARIAATGATGGATGSSQSDSTDSDCEDDSSAQDSSAMIAAITAAAATASMSSGFQAQNGLAAQRLNAQFQTLTASSSCSEGEQACVGTSFAQCVSGMFALTPCSAGTVCAALPLVNKPGTSIACDTSADVEARLAAAGVVGGITGL
ncbi:hypothetical protein B0H10DRAFT_2166790 [Mycena sp. CBHHK59/15]|nr:hypothetical protein B0H10DRAFT_2166790 [Mycena sp. CBHHK59/15]